MNSQEKQRKCPDCGNEMVSQKAKYQMWGKIIMVLAVVMAILGFVRIADGEMVDGLLSIAVGAIFIWGGLRRVRATPWFCLNCKTREFEKV